MSRRICQCADAGIYSFFDSPASAPADRFCQRFTAFQLTIAASGTNLVVGWPSLASNFNLQTVTSLMDPSDWRFATNIIHAPGLPNFAIFPAMDQSRFYRLAAR